MVVLPLPLQIVLLLFAVKVINSYLQRIIQWISTRRADSNELLSPEEFVTSQWGYGKPLDASDMTNLDDAKTELQYIRRFASEFLASASMADNNNIDGTQKVIRDDHDDKEVRGALYDKQDFSSFKKVSYEKTDTTRSLIYDAIKPNVLFENDTKDELLQIIDIFHPSTYKKGEVIINQGDEGDTFYVVESGKLTIHVTAKGEDDDGAAGGGNQSRLTRAQNHSQVKVGEYSKGCAFGELALMFGSPRAATITATTDCKLWSIDRMAYRSVISQLRYEQHQEKNAFVRSCVVFGKSFTDIYDGSQINDLTIAANIDVYEKGQVILREGEVGDTFYVSSTMMSDGLPNRPLLFSNYTATLFCLELYIDC